MNTVRTVFDKSIAELEALVEAFCCANGSLGQKEVDLGWAPGVIGSAA